MELSKRKASVTGSVIAGSVWESRMKSGKVSGGIKVINAEESPEEGGGRGGEGGGGNSGAGLKRSPIGVAASIGKRRTWKPEKSQGLDKSPRGKIEVQNNPEVQCKDKELVNSSEGIKKSTIHYRKVGASTDKLERSTIQSRKVRSGGESREGYQRVSGQLRKTKSESSKKNASVSGINSVPLRKTKSESDRVSDDSRNGVDGSYGGSDEKIQVGDGKSDADEICKEFDVPR